VDPDDVVALQQREQLAREQLVHAPVAAQVAGLEMRQVQPVMEDRPQHAIGIAAIVGVMVVLAQVQLGQGDAAGLAEAQFTLAGRAAFDHLAAPAEPQAAGLLQGFAQGHRKSAGGGLAWIGQAIGYHHESGHQITASQDADRRIAQLMMPTIE
jgi:hypothetical protein